jgi:Ca2+-binding EF-hand superfamily protein
MHRIDKSGDGIIDFEEFVEVRSCGHPVLCI